MASLQVSNTLREQLQWVTVSLRAAEPKSLSFVWVLMSHDGKNRGVSILARTQV